MFDRCSWRNLCCRCCHIQGDGGETVPAGCSCLVFDLLLCALLQGCLFIGLCASFLSCLLDFLPLVGLSKWFLAALINLLILVWEGHSSVFRVSKWLRALLKKFVLWHWRRFFCVAILLGCVFYIQCSNALGKVALLLVSSLLEGTGVTSSLLVWCSG